MSGQSADASASDAAPASTEQDGVDAMVVEASAAQHVHTVTACGEADLGEAATAVVLSALLEELQAVSGRWQMLFEWVDGPLVTAMRNGEAILIDEISLADDSVLERINSVLEPGRSLVSPLFLVIAFSSTLSACLDCSSFLNTRILDAHTFLCAQEFTYCLSVTVLCILGTCWKGHFSCGAAVAICSLPLPSCRPDPC